MEKVIRITTLRSRENDYEYWMSKTPIERLAAIEFLRQQYIQFNNLPDRMQKVVTICNSKTDLENLSK